MRQLSVFSTSQTASLDNSGLPLQTRKVPRSGIFLGDPRGDQSVGFLPALSERLDCDRWRHRHWSGTVMGRSAS
jgi:hypothetical protein